MNSEIQTIEFSGFLLDNESKTDKQRFTEPVGTITFNKGNKSATLTLNSASAKKMNLKLSDEEILENRKIEDAVDEIRPSKSEIEKLTKVEKKALELKIAQLRANKKSKTVTFFKGKNAKGEAVVSLFNSTLCGAEVPDSKKQTVSASSHTVKLPSLEVKDLYELSGLPTGENFKDAKDWIFKLIIGATKINESTTVESCYFTKFQEVVIVEKEVKERSAKQDALADNMNEWYEAERLAGRAPSPRKFWKAHPELKKETAN